MNITFKSTTFALILNFTESRKTYYRLLAWNTIYNVISYHTLNYYLTLIDRILTVINSPNEARAVYNITAGCLIKALKCCHEKGQIGCHVRGEDADNFEYFDVVIYFPV